MPKFIILFGNTTLLSELEFKSLYPDLELIQLSPQLFLFESPTDQSQEMMSRLGGAVKIFKLLKEVEEVLSDEDYTEVVAQLIADSSQDIEFTLTQAGKKQRNISNSDLKRHLKKMGYKSRYFSGEITDSAVLLHHPEVIEILSIVVDHLYLARAVAVQDIDDWTKRDRSKPYADRQKGMLPPKVARMMVNIAMGQRAKEDETVLYDPFCGTGTVLMEAAMRGLTVIGSDLDPRAVSGSQENLTWLQGAYAMPVNFSIFQMDAGHINPEFFGGRKVDLLVTEPFLGRQTPSDSQLANIFKGLEKMYLGAMKSFTQVLNEGAILAMVFPMVKTDKREYNLSSLIDKLASRGYNSLIDPIVYAREGARVARQIVVFKFVGFHK
jgi:tRNA G10  N-methylase Trm11